MNSRSIQLVGTLARIRSSRVFLASGIVCLFLAAKPVELSRLPDLARKVLYRVEPLANYVGISTRYLNALFVNGLGIGVKRWLRELRFLDAVQALREGHSWDDVAVRVGLSHRRKLHQEVSYFAEMPWNAFLLRLGEMT